MYSRGTTCSIELGNVFFQDRQFKEAVEALEEKASRRRDQMSDTDPARLTLGHSLASAYLDNGEIRKVVVLLEHVVATNASRSDTGPCSARSAKAAEGVPSQDMRSLWCQAANDTIRRGTTTALRRGNRNRCGSSETCNLGGGTRALAGGSEQITMLTVAYCISCAYEP